ncbi:MAG TPA: inositol monophosphatase family protein, partial [Dongiaceae bacterium]
AQVAAEEIMPRYAKLAAGDIREKGPGDLVTIADEAAEHRLTPALIQLLPGSVVVGEEAAAADPSVIDRLDGGDPVWVIDPVDGTANFAAAKGDFGVMVSLIQGGRTLAAWIYDPRHERMAAAELGGGAWLDGVRIRVAAVPADPAELSGPLLGDTFGDIVVARRVRQRRDRVRALKSLRCAAAEYVRLADGGMHFALFSKLMPWDHAAGVLLHGEAGGYSAYLDRGRYQPARLDAPALMLAPDEASWHQLYERLVAP